MEKNNILIILWICIGIIMTIFSKRLTRLFGDYSEEKKEYSIEQRINKVKITGIMFIISGIILLFFK
jgi:uncharacterized membrane protein